LGGKYNLALRKIDTDTGFFFQQGMPLRAFLSLKTTLKDTEVYSEGLAAFAYDKSQNLSGAFNLGAVHEFLNKKLTVNGEFFYNNEGNSFFYSAKTDFKDAETSPFIEGANIALNLLYRFGGKGNFSLFLQTLYAVNEKSGRMIPGFRLSPLSHIDIYFAIPVDLGYEDGYYYKNSWLKNRDDMPLRFAAVFLISLTGNLKFTAYSPD
jgi:hypothetical protein